MPEQPCKGVMHQFYLCAGGCQGYVALSGLMDDCLHFSRAFSQGIFPGRCHGLYGFCPLGANKRDSDASKAVARTYKIFILLPTLNAESSGRSLKKRKTEEKKSAP
uniref:Uncharacterized protein n=1 Tax=Candidatus Kentrum sp. MB TaxID=2138164 RepID=A0A450XMH5_9GAMM|nr:MAG: hypothetical protein BECKMB1821G_GA0114241_100732 [Candidatus Kentron sp. MB]VFK30512.1 MAG: hypothetical protein BECKMB1821I_GA0114274_101614 [Candidatus Kentron sp. MB]VFK75281.1 MAG: hypothetical protein BECKMB1821H_GA0114242_101913 [Candidatus Kentron sp. MB]